MSTAIESRNEKNTTEKKRIVNTPSNVISDKTIFGKDIWNIGAVYINQAEKMYP